MDLKYNLLILRGSPLTDQTHEVDEATSCHGSNPLSESGGLCIREVVTSLHCFYPRAENFISF